MEGNESQDDEKDSLVTSIRRLYENMQEIVNTARKYVNESVEEFVSKEVGCLFPLMSHYVASFQRHDVTTRKSFDKLIKKHYRDEDIQEAYEELLQTEHEWDNFLSDIDKTLVDHVKVKEIKQGGPGPNDEPLTDVRTGQQAKFQGAGSEIVVVSFGVEAGAKNWLQETKCPYTMLLDPARKIYGSMGLHQAISKTWGTKPLLYYAEQVAAGRELPAAYKNIEDDTHQMGGDLILDHTGKVVFIYCSQSSPDRPSVDTLLKAVQDDKEEASASSPSTSSAEPKEPTTSNKHDIEKESKQQESPDLPS